MSCGEPHETDCARVLDELWLLLDHECGAERKRLLKQHLDECYPCLERYGIEEQLKALLHRKCGGDHAPDELKARLRESLRRIVDQIGGQVVVQQREVTVQGGSVEVSRTRTEVTEVDETH
jgi:mycothiol system anti-sigma-R factor